MLLSLSLIINKLLAALYYVIQIHAELEGRIHVKDSLRLKCFFILISLPISHQKQNQLRVGWVEVIDIWWSYILCLN